MENSRVTREEVERFLFIPNSDYGYGSGDGRLSGYGHVYVDGNDYGNLYEHCTGDGDGRLRGDGRGYGDGNGYGNLYGSGSGDGYGSGYGAVHGYGYGHGNGYGTGWGNGSGYGYGDDANIDIEEFSEIAKEHGWFTEDGGTTFLNMNNMLNYYGIENEMVFHQSIEDIEDCLNEGGKVIVSIDCHEIWYGEDNNIFAPESSSNHAVEVIGIDRTDPEHPMVILNDSGSPKGRGEMIPLEVFEGAWEDGDCQMIKCYPSK